MTKTNWRSPAQNWFCPMFYEYLATRNPELRKAAEKAAESGDVSDLKNQLHACFVEYMKLIHSKYADMKKELAVYFIEKAKNSEAWDYDVDQITDAGEEPAEATYKFRFNEFV